MAGIKIETEKIYVRRLDVSARSLGLLHTPRICGRGDMRRSIARQSWISSHPPLSQAGINTSLLLPLPSFSSTAFNSTFKSEEDEDYVWDQNEDREDACAETCVVALLLRTLFFAVRLIS